MNLQETTDVQKLAIMAIHNRGYTITARNSPGDSPSEYIAVNQNNTFYANSLVSLLGLIELGESRGEDWWLDDTEVEYVSSHLNR
jgi:hypothetical protein